MTLAWFDYQHCKITAYHEYACSNVKHWFLFGGGLELMVAAAVLLLAASAVMFVEGARLR